MRKCRKSKPHVIFLAGIGACTAAELAGAQNAPTTAQLLAQIEALEARIEHLEERAAEPSTLTAPFEVKAADGRRLLVVEEEEDSAVLRLYDPSGSPAVEATAAEGGEGEVLVGLEAKLAAAISVDREGGSFDVFLNGNKVATVNGEDGTGSIELRDATESVGARVRAEPGGTGYIELLRDGEQVAARLESGEGAGLKINDASGATAVEASVDGEGQGSFDVLAGGNRLASMNGEEGGGVLRLYDASGAVGVEATVGPQGDAGVIVAKQGSPVASMSVGAGRGAFDVVADGNRLASMNGDEGGGVLRLYDASGAVGVDATVGSQGDAGVVVAKQGNPVASMTVSAEGQGSFDVVSGANKLATMNGDSGSGGIVLHDSSGSPGVWLTALPGGTGSVTILQGDSVAAELGPGESANAALRIFNGPNQVAAIGRSPITDGGALRIFGGGGQPKVSLDSFDAGGAVNVYAAGGQTPVAALTVEGSRSSGVVAVYNNGTPIAFLHRSSGGDGGNVTAALNDGSGVFSAGAAQNGAGEACVNRRGGDGTPRATCLGIGLPLR